MHHCDHSTCAAHCVQRAFALLHSVNCTDPLFVDRPRKDALSCGLAAAGAIPCDGIVGLQWRYGLSDGAVSIIRFNDATDEPSWAAACGRWLRLSRGGR